MTTDPTTGPDAGTPPGGRPPLAAFKALQRVFVVPEWKLVYVSTPKNACTSIKWVIAELVGEDLDRLRQGAVNFITDRDGQIHRRELWQVLPPADVAADGIWDEVDGANGWHVFGVVRDPRLRFFSAWQDKFLLQNPGFTGKWPPEQLPPPTTAEDVIERFARFTFAAAGNRDHPRHRDGHFYSNTHGLRPDVIPYTRLYDMSELAVMMADLDAHLRRQGYDRTLRLGRSNSTPFAACGPLFENGVGEAIEQMYAEDFRRFGDRWDFAKVAARPVPWTAESFAHARSIIEMSERLGDLVRTARRLQRRNDRLAAEVEELRGRQAAADRPGPAWRDRLRAAGRPVSRALRRG